MISFIEGKIEYSGDKWAIINAGGIGYRIYMVPKILSRITKSQEEVNPSASLRIDGESARTIKVFVHSQMNMREGTFDLYGFDTKQNLDLFNTLLSVSGIGPKMAMSILALVEPQHLKAAVMNDDAAYLKRVSGLGPKTAGRLILELKNKVDHIDIGNLAGANLTEETQALDALVSLGYSQGQAKDALKEVTAKGKSLSERVRDALKLLGKK